MPSPLDDRSRASVRALVKLLFLAAGEVKHSQSANDIGRAVWCCRSVSPDRLRFLSAPNQGSSLAGMNLLPKSPEKPMSLKPLHRSTRRLIRVCPRDCAMFHALRGRLQILPHEILWNRQKHTCASNIEPRRANGNSIHHSLAQLGHSTGKRPTRRSGLTQHKTLLSLIIGVIF